MRFFQDRRTKRLLRGLFIEGRAFYGIRKRHWLNPFRYILGLFHHKTIPLNKIYK